MTQIKIEVPANDHIALSAMADALQRIATERHEQDVFSGLVSKAEEGYSTDDDNELDEVFTQAKQTLSTINDMVDDDTLIRPDHDEAFEEGEKLFDAEIARMDEERERDDTLDADGIPHDNRIHSKGATRLADNTWRLRKRPADKTEEEWTAYIDSVKAELKAVQDIPTLDEQAVADLTPPVIEEQVREEIKEKLEPGEVTVEAPLTPTVIEEPATQLEGVTPNGDVAIEPPVTVGTPVTPVTPPTSLTPPSVESTVEPSDKPSVTTFQELMLYMTSDAKKRGADNDMIKATLLEVDPALTAIPLIATRADLIPKFVTALEAKLK